MNCWGAKFTYTFTCSIMHVKERVELYLYTLPGFYMASSRAKCYILPLLHLVEEAGWASRPVWRSRKNLAHDEVRTPDLPFRNDRYTDRVIAAASCIIKRK
jgi:hypothetical protein